MTDPHRLDSLRKQETDLLYQIAEKVDQQGSWRRMQMVYYGIGLLVILVTALGAFFSTQSTATRSMEMGKENQGYVERLEAKIFELDKAIAVMQRDVASVNTNIDTAAREARDARSQSERNHQLLNELLSRVKNGTPQ